MIMKKDDKAPATKKDIRLLMRQMAAYYDKTEKRIVESRSSLEENLDERIDRRMERWKKEIVGEFHIFAGQLRHDFKGAFADRLQQHDERISRLERHTGLLAA